MSEVTDHFLDTLEKGHLEPEVKVVSNGHKRYVPSYEEIQARRKAVKNLSAQGLSIDEIALCLDMERHTVERDLKAPVDVTPPAILERRRRVQTLHDQGLSFDDIVKALGLTDSTVRNDFMRLGLKTPTQLYQERLERVRELHGQGLDTATIGKELGMGAHKVGDYIRKLGLKTERDKIADRRAIVRRLYVEENLSQALIAKRLGVPVNRVGNDISRMGIGKSGTITEQTLRRDARREQVKALYAEGLSEDAIAARLEVGKSTIGVDIKDMNLASRKGVSPKRYTNVDVISNGMNVMDGMATVLLDQPLGKVDESTYQKWLTTIRKVRRAMSHVQRNTKETDSD